MYTNVSDAKQRVVASVFDDFASVARESRCATTNVHGSTSHARCVDGLSIPATYDASTLHWCHVAKPRIRVYPAAAELCARHVS